MNERDPRWLGGLVLSLAWMGGACVGQPIAPAVVPQGTAVEASQAAAATAMATPAATAPATAMATAPQALALPALLQGKAVVLEASDPDYARADLAAAIKAEGEGALQRGIVIRVSADVPVWRMWNGPAKKDERGNTNRMGQWWSYDAPHGTQQGYRKDYEICGSWNDLTWMARCTLKAGAVVAIGPGNSVSAKTCGDAAGKEAYPANERDWQVWVSKAWSRGKELECPPDTTDYAADPADLSHALKVTVTKP